MIRRNIQERVRTIAPFLSLDHDPYLVISDGRMFWMQDAYTTSSYFPSAQPVPELDLNYIRNAVKIVIDAYNGTVDFYLMDPARPDRRDLPAHLSDVVQAVHGHAAGLAEAHSLSGGSVPDSGAAVSDLPHGGGRRFLQPRGSLAVPAPAGAATAPRRWRPYYIIMRLPGEPQAEFFIMLPMVPSRRDNMIAWLAARCDAPDYGKLIVYEFPKEKLVYGPFQIEARINQNTEISQQLTLWNQMGSRVIRGQPAGDPDRELDPLRVAALSAGGAGTTAGAETRDRGVRRTCRHEGDARRGPGGAVHGTRCCAGDRKRDRGGAPREPGDTSGTARRSIATIGRWSD